LFSLFDLLRIKEISEINKNKIYHIISKVYAKKYTIKVHQKIINIAKCCLNEMTNLQNILYLKNSDEDIKSQLLNFQFKNILLTNINKIQINPIKEDIEYDFKNLEKVINRLNKENFQGKNLNLEFNNLKLDNDLDSNVQRISTLDIIFNTANETVVNSVLLEKENESLRKKDEINSFSDIQSHIDSFNSNSKKNSNLDENSFLIKSNLFLNNQMSTLKKCVDSFTSINDKPKINENEQYKKIILENVKNMQCMLELLENLITYKDQYQQENFKKIAKDDKNQFNEYLNKLDSDVFNFNRGFLFQNYINNGIILDSINNFPKKGYSIIFSFKWDPLYEQSLDKKCDLFYLLGIKSNSKNSKESNNPFNTNFNENDLNKYTNKEEFLKYLKMGCYIFNRKIYISDPNNSLETNIEVIPGVSYVLIIEQKEPSGLVVKKNSKVSYIYLFFKFFIKISIKVNNSEMFSSEDFLYPVGNMKLYLGTDGLNKTYTKNKEIYFLEMGTFCVFNEIFKEEIIENLFNLKGFYDLILFRNYEIAYPINNDKKQILNNVRSYSKSKIEQGVVILVSENVIILNYHILFFIYSVHSSKFNIQIESFQ